MSEYYILTQDGKTLPADIDEWMAWRREHPRANRVASDEIGEATVSTVFLGLNHNWGPGEPLLFETMIFEGEWDQWGWRWSTKAEARSAHDRIVTALREGKSPESAVAS